MPLTYHGKPELKVERIANAKRHRDQDLLITGQYIAGNKGCSVGCDARDLGGLVGACPHKMVACHWGTPLWLEHMRDALFEHCCVKSQRADWHVAIAEAIPVGVDLTPVYHKFILWMLSDDSPSKIGNAMPDVVGIIAEIRELHTQALDRHVSTDEWMSLHNRVDHYRQALKYGTYGDDTIAWRTVDMLIHLDKPSEWAVRAIVKGSAACMSVAARVAGQSNPEKLYDSKASREAVGITVTRMQEKLLQLIRETAPVIGEFSAFETIGMAVTDTAPVCIVPLPDDMTPEQMQRLVEIVKESNLTADPGSVH